MATVDRFMKFVDKQENCWIWTGSRLTSGYGQAVRPDASERYIQGKPVQEGAHRVAYRIWNGEIASGKVVRHLCHNKLCVNPCHLIIGSQKENMADSQMSERASKRKRNERGQFVCL